MKPNVPFSGKVSQPSMIQQGPQADKMTLLACTQRREQLLFDNHLHQPSLG